MDQRSLEKLLADLPLRSVQYFSQATSTNDLAAGWAQSGAEDASLVVADEQTAGRGRGDRRWFTPPGAGLAFSLILKDIQSPSLTGYSGLGALAICQALERALPDHPTLEIKWPNDVLAAGRKLAGVLPEAQWFGDRPEAIILGIGINIASSSVPPAADLSFPATCLEALAAAPLDRWGLLKTILSRLLHWRMRVGTPEMIQEWESRLAYRDQWVHMISTGLLPIEGRIIGLDPQGGLKLRHRSGEISTFRFGEIQLRPVDMPGK